MCNQFTVLAQNSSLRSISICEHDTVHIEWDHIVLFLRPIELQKVDMVLETTLVEREATLTHPKLYHQQTDHWLAEHPGYFELWIGQYGIELSPTDYLVFCSLINKAATQLNKPPDEESSPARIRIVERFDDDANALGISPINFLMN